MADQTPTVHELADELNIDPKTIRAWMRRQGWRHPVEVDSAWALSIEQSDLVRQHFTGDETLSASTATSTGIDNLARVSVGQLLERYAGVLAELRRRGLIRTNYAPIGDLAEYCAAMVYVAAREWTAGEVQKAGKYRAHTNGVVVRVGQVKSASARGVDRTGEFRQACHPDDAAEKRTQARPTPGSKKNQRPTVDRVSDVICVLELEFLAMFPVDELGIGGDLLVHVEHRPDVEAVVAGEPRDALDRGTDRSRLRGARVDSEANERVLPMVHFNQALGASGNQKYQELGSVVSLTRVADLLRRHAPDADLTRLARMVILAVAIGNLDLHTKNLGLLHPTDGRVTLAPAYDVVPQTHLRNDGTLALAVNKKYRHCEITRDDLHAEFAGWGLRRAAATIDAVLDELDAIVKDEAPLEGAFPLLQEQLAVFIENLRYGRPAGGSSR